MGDSIDPLARSFERHLRAENKAERTVHTYLEALGQLAANLRAAGREGLVDAPTEDIEAFLGGLLVRRKPGTAANRYRSLPSSTTGWRTRTRSRRPDGQARDAGGLRAAIPGLDEAALRRLLDVRAGRDFWSRRDTAMILLLLPSVTSPTGRPRCPDASAGTEAALRCPRRPEPAALPVQPAAREAQAATRSGTGTGPRGWLRN